MAWVANRWRDVNKDLSDTKHFWKRSPTTIQRYETVQILLQKYAKGSLLDIGSANGVFRSSVPNGVKYHACDFNETMDRYHKDSCDNFMCDVQEMPCDDESYDTVLCTEVLEHVPSPRTGACEIIRILKPGGTAIISVPFMGYYHNVPYDYYRFTQYGLRELFKSEKIEVAQEEALGGFFTFLGYIRSTVLLVVFFRIPIVGSMVFWINYLLGYMDIFLDRVFSSKKIVPVTNVLVIKKKQ